MSRDQIRQSVNVLAVVATLAVNGLANALPLNGRLTGAISDQFKVFFVPAGYVFAIWGVIYLGMIAFAVYQALPSQRENPRLRQIGYWFALSCAANIAWLFLWHYEIFVLTLVAMLALLATLIVIYWRLNIGRSVVRRAEQWCVDTLISVYLGWITVATIANVTDVLDYIHWSGWGVAPEMWAVILMVIGAGLAAAMIITRGDSAYLLVLIWAFAGIAVKQAATPLVANAAWVVTGLVAVALIAGWLFRAGRRPSPKPAA
jgi:hypothetical protein